MLWSQFPSTSKVVTKFSLTISFLLYWYQCKFLDQISYKRREIAMFLYEYQVIDPDRFSISIFWFSKVPTTHFYNKLKENLKLFEMYFSQMVLNSWKKFQSQTHTFIFVATGFEWERTPLNPINVCLMWKLKCAVCITWFYSKMICKKRKRRHISISYVLWILGF